MPAPALTPRQERFCRYYLTEPSATRAAVKAGYSANGAGQAAHRMLKNVEILQRIDALRRSEKLIYELSPQAVMDRCEALFEEALEKGRYEAAIGALRLQAKIGGLLAPERKAATKQDLAGAIDYAVRAAVSRYVTYGTVGSLNHMAPPPWPPGEETARQLRDAMVDQDEGDTDRAPRARLTWPGDETETPAEAAMDHENAFQRAAGLPPLPLPDADED
ncbi:MAG: terminase small subunit [Rhodospirillaceae bacterium]|nr:terminase small subunit [Rhodospirillaceae bacterium]